jgi:predicted  nucleic acid-binding Zn-ribbon protein
VWDQLKYRTNHSVIKEYNEQIEELQHMLSSSSSESISKISELEHEVFKNEEIEKELNFAIENLTNTLAQKNEEIASLKEEKKLLLIEKRNFTRNLLRQKKQFELIIKKLRAEKDANKK